MGSGVGGAGGADCGGRSCVQPRQPATLHQPAQTVTCPERRRADRRRERAADLRLAGFATVAVLVGMSSLFVWMHFTQGVRGQLDQLSRGHGANPLDERRRATKARIVSSRERAEEQLHESWDRFRAADSAAGRVSSKCAKLQDWQSERRPCPPVDADKKMGAPIMIVTDHFNPTTEFLLPHYDELGDWQVSLMQPTLWNVAVSEAEEERRLRCAEHWLALTHAFDPAGSVSAAALAEADADRRRLAKADAAAAALAADPALASAVVALATEHPSVLKKAAAEGGQSNGTVFDALLPPGRDEPAPERLRHAFAEGMRWVVGRLVPTEVSEWSVSDVEHLHGIVCAAEPAIENVTAIGKIRPEVQHVGFGFDLPPPLGFEVPFLMQLFEEWLHLAGAGCSSPVLLAFDALALLHRMQPFQNCNSRVAKLLMNAVLLRYGYPPLHMFLYSSKDQTHSLLNKAYNGDRSPLYEHLLAKLVLVGDVVATGSLHSLGSVRD
eukprot:TRINITY_DN1476_c1_g1_i1.p1 TRINITY_DN1476_c1_g1~~TRINITY_DN1476_c1_g1_i1.p1  ORF type:complete len:517 (+),score=164.73 TRINITY_DN1476_c1_g1_i1:65-1552(+)